jgi:hypothetical protein
MIKQGHMGTACAFRDLGYSPEQVKLAFINRGVSEEEADYLVKEAWGAITGAIGKAVPWLAKTFGSRIGGAASGTLTKGLMSGGRVGKAVGGGLHRFGQAAQHSLGSFKQNPIGSLGGGVMTFGRGMFFSSSKTPSLANMAGKGFGLYGMGQMVLGPGQSPMPTPQTQNTASGMGQQGQY